MKERVDDLDKSSSFIVGEAPRRSTVSLGATLNSQVLFAPLLGRTPLWKVFWIYGFALNCAVSLASRLFEPMGQVALFSFIMIALIVGAYQLLALWRCAYNSRWRSLGSIVRACVAVSVLSLPFLIYILLTRAPAPN